MSIWKRISYFIGVVVVLFLGFTAFQIYFFDKSKNDKVYHTCYWVYKGYTFINSQVGKFDISSAKDYQSINNHTLLDSCIEISDKLYNDEPNVENAAVENQIDRYYSRSHESNIVNSVVNKFTNIKEIGKNNNNTNSYSEDNSTNNYNQQNKHIVIPNQN